jgi:hypothetical protein
MSAVGLDEEKIRQYIRDQEKAQRDLDRGELEFEQPTGPFWGPSSYHRFYRWLLIRILWCTDEKC